MSEEQQQPCKAIDYFDTIETSVGTNRDTKGLGTMGLGCCIVGSIGPINGEDGKEVPDFDLRSMSSSSWPRYWIGERIDSDFEWFAYQQSGSSEWRWSVFISRRLNRLAEVLGEEAVWQVGKERSKPIGSATRGSTTKIGVSSPPAPNRSRRRGDEVVVEMATERNKKADDAACHPQRRALVARKSLELSRNHRSKGESSYEYRQLYLGAGRCPQQ